MKKSTIIISALATFLVISIGLGIWWLSSSPLKDFDYARDAQEILKIFERDKYWLLSSDDYSPEFMLKNKAPNQYDLRYFGQLHIKVLWEHDKFIGFTAYYMKAPALGFILFMAVNPEFRGKR